LSSKSTFSNATSKSYAQALYELLKENSELDKAEKDMISLNELLKASSDFKEMTLNPTIGIEEKKKVIFSISKQNNFSDNLKKFLGFVAIKNRLFYLDKIIESFLNLVSNNKGELKAKLISSKKLSIKQQQEIQNELSKNFKSPLKIEYRYDPNLIVGLIVQVGSVMVDTSINSKLKQLEKNMIEA